MPSAGISPAARPPAGPGGATVVYLGADDTSSPRVRMVDAALRCVARQGTRKTTVDDIAKEAGFSRATLYRTFPGGREAVFEAAVETEVARLFSSLAVVMGEAQDLKGVLVEGMVAAARRISSHPGLGYLLEHEPGVVLPHLAFAEMDGLLSVASTFAAPFLARWLDPDEAARAAEWAARILASYLLVPAGGVDLTEPADVERLVARFVLPGIWALRAAGPPAPGRPGRGRDRRRAATGRDEPSPTRGVGP